jgi:plasmid maintenance system antidote protein VapI
LAGVTVAVMDGSVGGLLRRHLEAAGFTQVEAAKHLQCSAKHLNQVLQGKQALSVDLAVSFERVCGWPGLAETALVKQVRADLAKRDIPLSS